MTGKNYDRIRTNQLFVKQNQTFFQTELHQVTAAYRKALQDLDAGLTRSVFGEQRAYLTRVLKAAHMPASQLKDSQIRALEFAFQKYSIYLEKKPL